MKKYKVLVLDDDKAVAESMRDSLEMNNIYEVMTINSSMQGLEVAKRTSFDAYLIDQRMPEMTGIEFVTELTKITDNPLVYIITAEDDGIALAFAEKEAIEGTSSIKRYVPKPWPQSLFSVDLKIDLEERELTNNLSDKLIAYQDTQLKIEEELRDVKHKMLIESEEAKREIKKSKEDYQFLVENIPIGVFQANTNDEVIFWNKRWMDISGINCDDIVGAKWYDTIFCKDKNIVLSEWEVCVKEIRPLNIEFRYQLQSGNVRWVFARMVMEKDEHNAVVGFVGAIIDITPRKHAELRLRDALEKAHNNEMVARRLMKEAEDARKQSESYQKDLELAYVHLEAETVKVQLLADRAEHAAKAKSDFLANMSHEIRTPMNAVLGYSKLLQESELPEEYKNYIDTIVSSGDLLVTIIDDILDAAKLEAGKISLELIDFDLGELCRDVIKMFMLKFETKHIQSILNIHEEVPLLLNGDPTRLRQVLINLVGNAIKFTQDGSIAIRVEKADGATDNDGVRLLFVVSDTGIGIPKEKVAEIFDPFSQVDYSITRTYGGSGLGLTICAKLIEMMGGEIWVESVVGEGSDFKFYVNVKQRTATHVEKGDTTEALPSTANESPVVEEKNVSGLHILVVEDTLTNQMLVAEYLKRLQCTYTFADNGEQAIEILKNTQNRNFDLCFMDLQMPVMDGFEATKIIRKEISQVLPIVGVSAAVFQEDKQKAEEAGMTAFLTKPLDIKKMRACLEKYAHKNIDE